MLDFLLLCVVLTLLVDILLQVRVADDVIRGAVLVLCVLFTLKDAVRGRSPGKVVFELRVVDARSLEPIGVRKSFIRNLPILFILIMGMYLPLLLMVYLSGVWKYVPDFLKDMTATGGSSSLILAFLGLLTIGGQLVRGPRCGDGWAHTQVVWEPFRRQPPFDMSGRICLECRYDLTGNVSNVCPECGTPVPRPEDERIKRDGQ